MAETSRPRWLTKGEREREGVKPEAAVLRQVVVHVASRVSVGWSWYDRAKGTVLWVFKNEDSTQHSVILLRNGYYFGGAFWPVYFANSGGRGASASDAADDFGVGFLDGGRPVGPLVDVGPAGNAAPLGLVGFKVSDPSQVDASNSLVCFVFTLAPGESWSMLEGGFSTQMAPSGISLYEATPVYGGPFCVGYDERRVADWDAQTGTTLRGYSPNPSTFDTWFLSAEGDAPYDVLPYRDRYAYGGC